MIRASSDGLSGSPVLWQCLCVAVLLMLFSISAGAQLNVVGLHVNDELMEETLDIELEGEDVFLKLEDVVRLSGVNPREQSGVLLFDTPMGVAELKLGLTKWIDGARYLNAKDLKSIGMRGFFSKRWQAVSIYVPWLPHLEKEKGKEERKEKVVPDFPAPTAGVSNFSSSLNYVNDVANGGDSLSLDAELFGSLGKGSWGLGMEAEDEGEQRVTDLYWSGYSDRHALRIGTSSSYIGSEVSGADFTGLQYGYSNKGIGRHVTNNRGVSSSFLHTSDYYTQDIRGRGPEGGIAELRIDGRPVARLRIGFDGEYAFDNLDIGRYYNQTVEVYIYEYSLATPPIERIDISKRRKPKVVSTGELFLQGGVGRKGNYFDETVDAAEYLFINSKYGVSNELTFEFGLEKDGNLDSPNTYVGFISNLGKNAVLGMALSDENDHSQRSWYGDMIGEWGDLDVSYNGRVTDYRRINDNRIDHRLDVAYRYSDTFTGILKGHYLRDPENGENDQDYLLPGGYWRPRKFLNFSVVPGDNGYQFDADYGVPEISSSFHYSRNEDNQVLSSHHKLSNRFDIDLTYGERFEDNLDYVRADLDYRPDYDLQQKFTLSIGSSSGHTGYRLLWNKYINPITRLTVGYSHEYSGSYVDLIDDDGFINSGPDDRRFMVNISTALSRQGDRSWRALRSGVSSKRGAISGTITGENGEPVSTKDLSFKVGRRNVRVNGEEGGGFVLGNLRPGIYPISLMTENLPIEYSLEKRDYMVEVAPAGITQVDIELPRRYAVSGRVIRHGSPVENAQVYIISESRDIWKSKSDKHGYYQVFGLHDGDYELRLGDKLAGRFSINGDFVFGADIEVANLR